MIRRFNATVGRSLSTTATAGFFTFFDIRAIVPTFGARVNVTLFVALYYDACDKRRMGAVSESAQGALYDRELVDRARSGDRAAFTELVRRHTPRARAMAFGACRDAEATHDIVQESFLRVWRHLDEFDGRASFATWLYRIVANLAIDHHRRNRKASLAVSIDDCDDSQLPTTADETDPCAVAQDREHEARVVEAIHTLSPAHRDVLIARANGKAYTAIAAEQGIPKGTVMSRLFHARRAYAEVMRGEENGHVDERIPTAGAYEGAGEDDMDITKQACNIGNVAKGVPALADPTKDIKIVAEGVEGGLFVAPTDATRGLVDPDASDASELRALYADTDGFIASGHYRAAHHLNMLLSVLIDGQQTEPKVVQIKGDTNVYTKVGRSRLVWWAIVWECLAGTRDVKALRAVVAERRETLGANWRPDFRVMSGGRGTANADEYTAEVMLENTGRKVIGERGLYTMAMHRIGEWAKAHRNDAKAPAPPYGEIARHVNRTENVVRSWQRLSMQNADVIDAVFSDAISINAVLQVCRNGASPDEVSRIVAEMIAAGATSVRDAIATRRASAEYVSNSTVDDRDDEGGGERSGGGNGERTERESPDAVTGSGTPRVPVQFAEKPLGARFATAYGEGLNNKGNQHETLALACMKLASIGWASLNKREKDAIKGVASLYGAVEDARKKAAEKAKKVAEAIARAKGDPNTDPNAASLVTDPK